MWASGSGARSRRAVPAIVRHLALGKETVCRWVARAEIDAGTRDGMSSAERKEIRARNAENGSLREGFAVLRAATTS